MNKRKMYLRMITASLLRRRSRMLVALLSIAVGAAILSGLVTIYYDVPRQMGAQFRSYGANMILLPGDDDVLTIGYANAALSIIGEGRLVGASPYRYVRLNMVSRQQSFMAAGADFEQVQKTSPYFSVMGRYPQSEREVLVGKEIADTIGLSLMSVMELTYQGDTSASGGDGQSGAAKPNAKLSGSAEGWNSGIVNVLVNTDESGLIKSIEIDASSQTEGIGDAVELAPFTDQFINKKIPVALGADVAIVSGATVSSAAVVQAVNSAAASAQPSGSRTINFTVVGILDTGGDEEGYVFISLDDMAALTGVPDKLDVMELSVSATHDELEEYAAAIQDKYPSITPQLVRRVTRSETSVLGKLASLVFLVTSVVLVLTMICVSTTMMAVISERRKEIGLRKALGASDNSIRREFLGEAMLLGVLGGLLGGMMGFAFAQAVSMNVFGSSITFQPMLLPIAIIVSIIVTGASCLLPIKRAVEIDPALVLKGE